MKCDVVFLTLSLDLNAYNSKKAVPPFPLNVFVIKNELNFFVCIFWIASYYSCCFLKRVIDIYQNILRVTI